ncbi:AAA family ATPase [Candidatus Enterococcus testudinis]|nr:AAA family ATPase [Enterococcus sp. 8G7_MSG3316]
MLIDEIDATLYPAAQNKLINIIYKKSIEYGFQVFCTTHSRCV